MSEQSYLSLLQDVIDNGEVVPDRTGVGTKTVFGEKIEYDLEEGFPLFTTKKVHFKSIIHELLWFIKGDTNIAYLNDNGVSIWDEWADASGDLGPMYGEQWRSWGGQYGPSVDQLAGVIDSIIHRPHSRRHIVSSWDASLLPSEDLPPCSNPPLGRMALAPCHLLYQFYVRGGRLDCQVYQRSADLFLGVPFNVASYALLTHMVAQVTDLEPGRLIHIMGDCHIYLNHEAQCRQQLQRPTRALPTLNLDPSIGDIDSFQYQHIVLSGYNPHPAIKAAVAV